MTHVHDPVRTSEWPQTTNRYPEPQQPCCVANLQAQETMGPSRSPFGNAMSKIFKAFFPPSGKIWQGAQETLEAYENGDLRSIEGGKKVRLCVRNLSNLPLLMCWVSDKGSLSHFYKLEPSTAGWNDPACEVDKWENTCGGHAFCWIQCDTEEELDKIQKSKEWTKGSSSSRLIGGYRPIFDELHPVHVVTIEATTQEKTVSDSDLCCPIPAPRLRKRTTLEVPSDGTLGFSISSRLEKLDPTPWDTTKKVYTLKILGGWPAYVEPNWHQNDPDLEDRLAEDLAEVARHLPSHAVEYLRRNCPVWVNSSIKYGPLG